MDRGKGLFHVLLNEPATTISCGGASLFRGSGVVVFSASKVGGSTGSTLLFPGWHPPPTHHLKAQPGFFIVHWGTTRVKPGTFTSSTRKSYRWRRGASPPVQQVYFTPLAGARKTSGKERLSLSAHAPRELPCQPLCSYEVLLHLEPESDGGRGRRNDGSNSERDTQACTPQDDAMRQGRRGTPSPPSTRR